MEPDEVYKEEANTSTLDDLDNFEDEGDGFDWEKYLSFDAERAFDTHGRGIAMASKLSFSSIEYHGKGNELTATIVLE